MPYVRKPIFLGTIASVALLAGCTFENKNFNALDPVGSAVVITGNTLGRIHENPLNPRFDVDPDCIQWRQEDRHYNWQRLDKIDTAIFDLSDYDLIREFLHEKRGCRLERDRASALGEEIKRRGLMTVQQATQLRLREPIFLGAPRIAVVARLDDLSEELFRQRSEREVVENGREFSVLSIKPNDYACRHEYIFENDRVVGYHFEHCRPRFSGPGFVDEHQGIDL
ncbi:hypothetical protein [Oceaniradius stylonematis]|uniref:hypothetical protein n=1 Tax=Oceaniradius stylonematis TaxID=2184161 RepID=UPI003C7CD173